MNALPPLDVAPRLDRLRAKLDGAECDALIVTNLTNVRYLTGFTGSAGLLTVTTGDAVLITDGRYDEQASEQLRALGAPARVVITSHDQKAIVQSTLGECNRIGLEAASVTWRQQRDFQSWFERAELVPTDGLVEALRERKDQGEIARIEAAAAIASGALRGLAATLADGPTEREFAIELDRAVRRGGAAGAAFETIVASGPNAAKPHYRPGHRAIARGDMVVVDFGAIVDGYRSDMTRTFFVGDVTADRREIYDVVAGAQAAGVAAVAADVALRDIDAACRDRIASAGFGERFVHGTGHGVGLDIHEAPWVNARATATLAPGNIVTVEPGIYVPELGGVRIEDTLLVTASGYRVLTQFPKDPLVA